MSKKVYNVSIFFDLHGVSCPGVWLCPKGKILVKISLFGVSEVTKQVTPVFPLRFNERFHFQKTFRSAQTLSDLHARLHNSLVKMQIIQHPPATTEMVVLAVFCSTLTGILYPSPNIKSSETTADVDLLFCPCKIFPGIIAPKAEVSTRINVRETEEVARGARMNPATVPSQKCKTRMGKEDKIIRQRGVCHTPYNLHCKCFLSPKLKDKSCAQLVGSVRPRTLQKRPKSVTSFSPSEDVDSSTQTNGKLWSDLSRKTSNEECVKFQSRQKVTKKGYSEDEEPKKKPADVRQVEGLEGDTGKRKLCPCCRKFEPKVQFRNFSTSTSCEPRPSKSETAPKQVTTKQVTTKQAATITEDNQVKSKCEVCNCPVCIKYENYFIHRALKHNRGGEKSKFTESNVMSDSNDSAEVAPDLNPTKCYCFKDKKDFNNELQPKCTQVSQEEFNNSEKCAICKCPLTQNVDNKEMSEGSNNSLDRCAICKCPISSNLGRCGKDRKEGPEPSTSPPREQFYTDLDEYYGQLINCSEKQVRNPEIGRKQMKKPSSRLINQLQKKKWDFNEFEQKGTGIWDIKAAEWNRI